MDERWLIAPMNINTCFAPSTHSPSCMRIIVSKGGHYFSRFAFRVRNGHFQNDNVSYTPRVSFFSRYLSLVL